MIRQEGKLFILDTEHTTYAFCVNEIGYLEHLYYGAKIRLDQETAKALRQPCEFAPGASNVYDEQHKNVVLQDLCLENSSLGKSDVREPLIVLVHEDGSWTSDFTFESARISQERELLKELPCSYYEEGEASAIRICMVDQQYQMKLYLNYVVYEKEDVITRSVSVENLGEKAVCIRQLLSAQLDFDNANMTITTFNGAWAREMGRNDIRLTAGKHINSSETGASSNSANPFFMLSEEGTTQEQGKVYGCNLIYSGNHREIFEVSEFGKLRVSWGMQYRNFSWRLGKGEVFESPEAVMTFSVNGFNGMSANMHAFVREHVVRGAWKHKERPVLLNSWEAAYFDIHEKKLLHLAKAAKHVGVELFVMDDGWFGERNDDTTSLGDWEPNSKKLPSGLKGLASKINDLGMDFGIWVEPEMVNVKSKLYEEHPDWAIEIPGKPHSEGRNQRILDLSNKQVQDYIIESMAKIFSSANISYVKWDMNRTMTDVYSQSLSADRQGEVPHRYMLGLYRCMKELTEKFPGILFEGCASGGNRFDLGILSYFPQIWASDDTDAIARVTIQNGLSYGYPLNTIGAHVSGVPNHQTLRVTPLDTRFNVACFGCLGYECNLSDLSGEELAVIKEQIAIYKEYRRLFQYGSFYRGRNFDDRMDGGHGLSGERSGNLSQWTVVDAEKKQGVTMVIQKLVIPNLQALKIKIPGLDPESKYHFTYASKKIDIKQFGDLVNTVSPVHIKPGSFTQSVVAKFVKLDGEKEDITAYGDLFETAGVYLSPAFGGTGFNEKTRLFPDYASRMYFLKKTEN